MNNLEQSESNYQKELGLFGLVGESFKGTHKWAVVSVFTLMFIFLGLIIYCGYHFFNAEEIATKLNWLAGGITSFIIFGLLRLWYFMELNRISLKREIKRLELQVSLLVKKFDVLDK